MQIVGIRCFDPCLPPVIVIPIETNYRLWSNVSSWSTTGKIPEAGEDALIETGWNMLLDIDTPILRTVQVNGRLTFKNDSSTPLNLQAEHVFVRAGELIIGYADAPFQNEATITLHGKRQDDQIVLSSAVEAGNRILMNIANMSMYGKPRQSNTRLRSPALKGSVNLLVSTGLDWRSGDEIALAPTSFGEHHHDQAEILFYDASTGNLTIKSPLNWYHYGGASTDDLYGVDVRGEVILLTRNIKVRGKWECTILTSDYIEFDETRRSGQTIMDNVEIRDCSQENTHKTALRFQNAHGRPSSITNSALHTGMSWGINV